MKRLLPAPLIILTAITAFSQSPEIGSDDSISSYFAALSAMYPRIEGSEGERRALEFIREHVEALYLEYTEVSFENLPNNHSYSSTIEVFLPGERDDTFLLAVPLNHASSVGPDADGAASLALALGLLSHYAADTPPISLRVLFLGAEYGAGRGYPIGTRVFLRDFFPQVPTALLYLEMAAPAESLRIVAGGGGTVSPPWLIEAVSNASRAARVDAAVPPNMGQVYRLRAEDEPTRIGPFLDAGIPAVQIVAAASGGPEVEGWELRLLTLLVEAIDGFDRGIPTRWARHYLRVTVLGESFLIGEQAYVLGLLTILVLSLGYGMFARRRFGRYMKTIGRNFWNLPVYLLLIFSFLAVATLLMRGFFLLRNMPSLWQAAPIQYFLMKIFLAVFLFSIWSQVVSNLPFSKNGSFYSASALLFLFLDIVILSVINISLTYYFIWAFVFAFLFSIFRSRLLKVIALLLSPIWLVKAAFDLLLLPELNMAETLLLSFVQGNLLLAFFTLPFLLMLIRMDYLIRHPVRGGHGFTLKLSTAASGFVTAAFILYLAVHEPYGPENPQPIQATELIDGSERTRRLELESPAPLGELLVLYGDRQYDISSDLRELFLPQPEARDILDIDVAEDRFLGRVRYTISIAPVEIRPSTVALELRSSDEPLVVYNSSFPYATREQARLVEVFVGRNPPVPLEIGLTIAPVSEIEFSVRVTSAETVEPIFIVGEHIVPVVGSRVSRVVRLAGARP